MFGHLAACHKRTTPIGSPEPQPVVEVFEVGPLGSTKTIHAVGVVSRRVEISLSFPIGGLITSVSGDEGDAVRAGQTIATLDATPFNARVAQAAAAFERDQTAGRRYDALLGTGVVSEQRINEQHHSVTISKAALDLAKFDQKGDRLVAPKSGFILARMAQAGENVQSGQPIVRLEDIHSELIVKSSISDRDIQSVRPGDQVTMRFGSVLEKSQIGRVSKIGSHVDDKTSTVEVEIALPGNVDVRSGQIASIDIRGSGPQPANENANRIPALALLELRGSAASVMQFDRKSQTARVTQVQFIAFDGDSALIRGLPDGSLLIVGGGGRVAAGEPVRLSTAIRSDEIRLVK